MHQRQSNPDQFLARSLLDGRVVFLNSDVPAYLFTAGAAREHIVADLLSKYEFHRNCVYARTKKGLYVLEKFIHLKDVLAVLPANYFTGNRGVIIDAGARDCLRGSSTIGVIVQNASNQSTIEWITLSREGLRESNRRQLLPPGKTPPDDDEAQRD